MEGVVYEMAVRRSIERGLADAGAGRSTDAADVRREFGLAFAENAGSLQGRAL